MSRDAGADRRNIPSLVFLSACVGYCVPKTGTNYKGHENFVSDPCEFSGDELGIAARRNLRPRPRGHGVVSRSRCLRSAIS